MIPKWGSLMALSNTPWKCLKIHKYGSSFRGGRGVWGWAMHKVFWHWLISWYIILIVGSHCKIYLMCKKFWSFLGKSMSQRPILRFIIQVVPWAKLVSNNTRVIIYYLFCNSPADVIAEEHASKKEFTLTFKTRLYEDWISILGNKISE